MNQISPAVLRRIKCQKVLGSVRVLVDGEIVGQRPASDEAFTLGLQALAQKLVYEQMVAAAVTAQLQTNLNNNRVSGWSL